MKPKVTIPNTFSNLLSDDNGHTNFIGTLLKCVDVPLKSMCNKQFPKSVKIKSDNKLIKTAEDLLRIHYNLTKNEISKLFIIEHSCQTDKDKIKKFKLFLKRQGIPYV